MKNLLRHPLLNHPLFTLVVGSLLSLFFAWFFYAKSGEELAAEARRLREVQNNTLVYLENDRNNRWSPNVNVRAPADANGDRNSTEVEVEVPGFDVQPPPGVLESLQKQ